MRRICLILLALMFAVPCLASENPATQRAIAEYQKENYEEALEVLLAERLLATRDATTVSPTANYYTGLCQKQVGDDAAAVDSLKLALQSSPPVTEASVELVSSLMSLDRIDEALQWLAWAEKNNVSPREVAFNKGLIFMKQSRYVEARALFEKAKSGDPEQDQNIDFQIALTHSQSGNQKEALESLKAIITRNPGSEAASFAQEYAQRISSALSEKPWRLFLGVNYQYDDNVLLKSTQADATSETRSPRDSGLSESLRLEYDAALSSSWSTNLQYALQNNNYFRLSDYNMLSNGLTVSAIHRSEAFIATLPANLTHAALDNRNYTLQYSFKPMGTFVVTPQNLIQTSVGYTKRLMLQPAVSPENDRDADSYNGSLGYIFLYAEGQGMFNIRGEIVYEDATGSEWRNLGGKVGVDLLVPVVSGTKLIISGESMWQNYKNSLTGRNDTTVNASTTLSQRLWHDSLFLNIQYLFSRAYSNVKAYDYQRNIISSGVELRF